MPRKGYLAIAIILGGGVDQFTVIYHKYFYRKNLAELLRASNNITKGKTSDERKLNKGIRNPRELFYLKHFSGKFCRGKLSVKS